MRVYQLTCAIVLSACAIEGRDEVVRVSAPARGLDAVVVESKAETASTFDYAVHVVRKGRPARSRTAALWLPGALRSDSAFGVNIRWQSDSEVVVEYLSARRLRLRGPREVIGSDTVRVLPRSGIRDSTARAGAMRAGR